MYYHSQEENNMPKALGLSAAVMGLLALIGFFIVFGGAPRYGMGGIIVNYGTSDEGMGDDYMSVDEPSMDENANNVEPDRIDPEEIPDPVPSQQVTEQTVATQDMDDAPAIPQKEEKPVQANAEEATPEKKESKPAVNPNALYKGKKNNATGKGDGTGTKAGNQGSDLGDPLASNYGEGGSGDGNMMLDIANRKFEVPPNIKDDGQQAGRVAVQFTVNKSGAVTSARAGVRGTTISNRALLEKCERAMMSAKLNALENAPASQSGVIVFNFKLR